MHYLTLIFLLTFSLLAYEEDFNSYKDGTSLNALQNEHISFSSTGEWRVFAVPFSLFNTPVLIEPGSSKENSKLFLEFDKFQCGFKADVASDTFDEVIVVGYSKSQEIIKKAISLSSTLDLYSASLTLDLGVDKLSIETKNKSKLILDNIQTQECRLDDYTMTEELIANYNFDQYDKPGVISNAASLSDIKNLNLKDDIAKQNLNSITFWYKHTTSEDTDLINTSNYKLMLNSENFLEIKLNSYALIDVGGLAAPTIINHKITHNEWHHYALVLDGNILSVFIDSIKQTQFDYFPELYSFGEDFTLSSQISDYSVSNLIDELRLYSKTLDADDIKEIYYARESFNEAFEAGKEYCIKNPESCGLQSSPISNNNSIANDIIQLENKTFSVGWYLWTSENNNIYLLGGNLDTPRVWQLIPGTREWKPVHNAGEFDGYEAQDMVFESVQISEDRKSVSFGAAID